MSGHSQHCFENATQSAFENGAKDTDEAERWAAQYLEDGMSDCTRDCPKAKSEGHWYTRG